MNKWDGNGNEMRTTHILYDLFVFQYQFADNNKKKETKVFAFQFPNHAKLIRIIINQMK